MTQSKRIGLSVVVLLLAFSAGRWSAPEHVKVDTKATETEKKTEHVDTDTDRDRHREIKTTEVTRPDGTKEKTTQVIENTTTTKKTTKSDTDQITSTQSTSKEITASSSKVTISALAGSQVSLSSGLSPIVLGGSVTKPILGPITLGIFGLSSGTAGFSLGLTF